MDGFRARSAGWGGNAASSDTLSHCFSARADRSNASDMLRIWGRRNSINVQKVMWAVGELGLAPEHIDAGGSFGGLDTDEFHAINPNRRVPVIDDDGLIVWESHAIVRYLAGKYGPRTLMPEDQGSRAQSDMWTDWVLADLQPAFISGVFWNFYR